MKWHLAFSIIFLLVISWFLTNLVDWELASVAFLGADVWLVISGVVLTFFWPLVGTLRWRKVLSALSLEVPFSMAFKTVMIAFSTNIFVPAKSGDLVKVIAMSHMADKGKLTAGVVSERLGDLLILGFFSAVGGLTIGRNYEAGIGLILIICVTGLIVSTCFLNLKFRFFWVSKIWGVIRLACQLWKERPSHMLQAIFWSAVNWILAGVQIWFFFLAFGANINLSTVMALFPITILVTLLPITPGGLGVRESAFVLLFLPYADPLLSISASLGYYICNTGLTALFGTLFLRTIFGDEKMQTTCFEKVRTD